MSDVLDSLMYEIAEVLMCVWGVALIAAAPYWLWLVLGRPFEKKKGVTDGK